MTSAPQSAAHDRPRPASLRQAGVASWIIAAAFMEGHRVRTLVALPTSFLVAVVLIARRSLYVSSDGNGTVDIHRQASAVRRVLTIVAVGVVAVLVGMALQFAAGFAAGAVDSPAPIVVVQAALVMVVCVLMISVIGWLRWSRSGLGAFGASASPETPSGPRYVVAGLAQRPGTRWSALQLAGELLRGAESGTVFSAVAATDDLANFYEARGFTRVADSLHVYYVAP